MPSSLPPEVEAAARRVSVPGELAFTLSILHSLWLSAQVAQAEEDARLMCLCCKWSHLWRPSTREDVAGHFMWAHGHVQRPNDKVGARCDAGPIHDRLASLRAQLQALNP